KSNYLTHDILEIECDNAVAALELLENSVFVEETSIFGNNIHISVNDKYKSEGQIREILSGRNLQVQRIKKIVPTLEDVFIHLIENKG
ncbi:MAG TPA: DUF4162 domain-containing protein, partial [Ignavibacteriales bacterium]|nr:DUF4162 domain-containing protein [Ignavibacteriales bacterium]